MLLLALLSWPKLCNLGFITALMSRSWIFFIHSLARSLTRPSTHALTHSLTRSLAHSLTRSLTYSSTHPPTHPLTHSLAHSLTPSFTPSLPHSVTHSLTHSLPSSLTHSLSFTHCHSLIHSPTRSLQIIQIVNNVLTSVTLVLMLNGGRLFASFILSWKSVGKSGNFAVRIIRDSKASRSSHVLLFRSGSMPYNQICGFSLFR